MTHPIVNIDELDPQPLPPQYAPHGPAAERYAGRLAAIGPRTGMQQLSGNLVALAPGFRAFPFHSHRVNEEMFIVLEGTGQVRIGPETYPIRAGDIIACPAGGPETAHQLINTGTGELRYLAFGTTRSPEVAEFPETGKYGVLIRDAQGDGVTELGLRTMGKLGQKVDYWEGH